MINNFAISDFHKFQLTPELKSNLHPQDNFILTQVGLPNKILSNYYIFNHVIEEVNGRINLGYNRSYDGWNLYIDKKDNSVCYQAKGNHYNEIYGFYNSSLSQLMLSLFAFELFIIRIKEKESLGDYQLHHERYALLLKEIIFDIDAKATQGGVWYYIIDEMMLGVM